MKGLLSGLKLFCCAKSISNASFHSTIQEAFRKFKFFDLNDLLYYALEQKPHCHFYFLLKRRDVKKTKAYSLLALVMYFFKLLGNVWPQLKMVEENPYQSTDNDYYYSLSSVIRVTLLPSLKRNMAIYDSLISKHPRILNKLPWKREKSRQFLAT